jgi:hypothetical protein
MPFSFAKLGICLVTGTLFFSALFFQTAANAYETDTHFYATYAMARYAGIQHETASVIASSAQWPDETEILGSPMVPDVIIGTKMRRLFHFPCDPYSPEKGANSLSNLLGGASSNFLEFMTHLMSADLQKRVEAWVRGVNGLCETFPVHPMAYNMLDEGLERGNLIEAATAIHTIEDSFAHAGTYSNIGHAVFGHHPDRGPNFPVKYRTMVRAVMVALVAIRANLPDSQIDHNFRDPGYALNKANADMTIDELTDGYKNNEYVKNTYLKDPYKDPEYVKFAIEFFIKLAQNLSDDGDYFIDPEFNAIDWFRGNGALMARINKGDAGICEFPARPRIVEVDAANKLSYVDCMLTETLLDLIKYGEDKKLFIVDKFRARSLVEGFKKSEIGDASAVFDAKIESLKVQIWAEERLIKTLSKKESAARQMHLSKVLFLKQNIAGLRKEKRVKLYAAYDSVLQKDMLFGNSEPHRFIHQVAARLTASFLPRPLSPYHLMEFESEGILRQQELAMRIRNMRLMIYQLYHDFVRFVVNDKVWAYPKSRAPIQNLPFTTPDILPIPAGMGTPEEIEYNNVGHKTTNIKYVTFNYNQVDIWVEMAIRYLFPDVTNTLFPEDKCTVISEITKLDARTNIYVSLKPALDVRSSRDIVFTFFKALSNPNFRGCNFALPSVHSSSLSTLGWVGGPIMGMGSEFYSYALNFKRLGEDRLKLFADDLGTTHMLPDHELQHFQTDEGIKDLFSENRYKPFKHWGQLGPNQIEKRGQYFGECLRWAHETASDRKKFSVEYQKRMQKFCVPYNGLGESYKESQSH